MSPTCFDALDRHVIGGAADRPALTFEGSTWTYARLLEEVAAFGGVLRHCGVRGGQVVAIVMPAVPEAVVAVLACARIGAVHRLAHDYGASVLVTDASTAADDDDPGVVIVKQRGGDGRALREGRDYDWDVVLRAGRTDPAAWEEEAMITPYDEQTRRWLEPLLRGGTVELP